METEDYRPGLLRRLRDPRYAAGYLAEVLEHESGEAFLIALADVLEARQDNRSSLAKQAGITRQTFYHALSKDGNPRFATLLSLMRCLGLKFSVVPDGGQE